PPGVPPVSLAVATGNGRTLGPGKAIPGLASPLSAAFLSPGAGWVIGTKADASPPVDAILATTDGGATWQEQFSRPSPTR
ncbi:MAG TPA: hypothetical protein VGP90_15145, partial [Acidimicrobiia bacterium]|nr:hypothetical protein [Acidimicrobiia bacterium]